MAEPGCNNRSGVLKRQTDTAVYSTKTSVQIEEAEMKSGRSLNDNLVHTGVAFQELLLLLYLLKRLAGRIRFLFAASRRSLQVVCRAIRSSHPF